MYHRQWCLFWVHPLDHLLFSITLLARFPRVKGCFHMPYHFPFSLIGLCNNIFQTRIWPLTGVCALQKNALFMTHDKFLRYNCYLLTYTSISSKPKLAHPFEWNYTLWYLYFCPKLNLLTCWSKPLSTTVLTATTPCSNEASICHLEKES